MALAQRLDLRQTQALVMTPQLQQAIKLLQLSNLELAQYVEGELEQNPLLERDERAPADEAPSSAEAEPAASEESREAAELWDAEAGSEGGGDQDFGGDPDAWRTRSAGAEGSGLPGVERTVSRSVTLREHLLGQVNVDLADPADRIIATNLVELLDEAGYVTADLSRLAERLGCPVERVEATLARMQRFDPPGICARNLAECLANQLRERDRLDPAMQKLIENLPLLASRDVNQLMRLCGVDAEDLAEMVTEIKSLDPKPGLAFDGETAPPVTPDILMRPQP